MKQVLRLTESRLKRVITEALQDMFARIAEYVRGFGSRGKLPPADGRLSDYYDGAFGKAFEWASKSVDGAARDGIVYFRHNFEVNVAGRFLRNRRGLVYVERSIDLDTSEGFDSLGYKSVGECWSWKKGGASTYCSDHSLTNSSVWQVVLCGYVHPSSVDWVETIYLNSYRMKHEREVRMKDNALVEVSYIRIAGIRYNLGSPFLVNAGADKYSHSR